jgi:poly(3-hydroxybutyrate) depolymerase
MSTPTPYPTLDLVSDGIARVASYRAGGSDTPDAVVWLHGGDGWATEFLDDIRKRAGIVDIAPQGLLSGKNTGWVNPWEADLPKEAPDNLIDLRFVVALEKLVRATFTSVQRVWLCGFSAGAGLVWSLWALHARFPHGFSGISVVGKKLRHEILVREPWDVLAPPPLPFVMVHGARDDAEDPSTEHFSWEESYAEARRVNGNRTNRQVAACHSSCCDPTKLVHRKVASEGAAPSARYVVDRVGHSWQVCEQCHTDDFVIEQFSDYGLGA